MAIQRKTRQMLTYLRDTEADEFDEAVEELEVSRADLIRQCILDYLEKRRQAAELVDSLGDTVVVGEVPAVVLNPGDSYTVRRRVEGISVG